MTDLIFVPKLGLLKNNSGGSRNRLWVPPVTTRVVQLPSLIRHNSIIKSRKQSLARFMYIGHKRTISEKNRSNSCIRNQLHSPVRSSSVMRPQLISPACDGLIKKRNNSLAIANFDLIKRFTRANSQNSLRTSVQTSRLTSRIASNKMQIMENVSMYLNH